MARLVARAEPSSGDVEAVAEAAASLTDLAAQRAADLTRALYRAEKDNDYEHSQRVIIGKAILAVASNTSGARADSTAEKYEEELGRGGPNDAAVLREVRGE